MFYDFFSFFPRSISKLIENSLTNENINYLEEIRLRANKNIILKFNDKEIILDYIVTSKDLLETLQIICENSIYSYQKEICEGYITVKGGHRVGITGECVIEDGKIINIKYISSLNFRIAREVIGCSNYLMENVVDKENKAVYNTLIVSLPGAGKTTLLRDIVRNISNGLYFFEGQTVGLIDERGEIAACFKGIPQNDVGLRTDVIANIPKNIGIKMLIRSMAPKVIAVDEIGNKEDVEALQNAICSRNKNYLHCTW